MTLPPSDRVDDSHTIDEQELAVELASFRGLEAVDLRAFERGRFAVQAAGGRFDCYLRRRPGAQRLFVLLSGAVNRRRRALPYFNRWKWADRFPGHILCVSDPTLYLSEELALGWYLGTAEVDWTRTLALIAARVAGQLCVAESDVTCYGSSGGGFAAIMLARHLHGAGAIAVNPQTDVLRYHPRHVRAMLDVCFPGTTIRSVPDEIAPRLSVIRAARSVSTRVLIAQNRTDDFHRHNHFTPNCDAAGLSPTREADRVDSQASLLYQGEGGHFGAEPRELVPRLISTYDSLEIP